MKNITYLLYYGGENASITPLEEVSYVPYIDRNSYYGGESAYYSTGRGKLPLPVE
jgi:hypothetical protein